MEWITGASQQVRSSLWGWKGGRASARERQGEMQEKVLIKLWPTKRIMVLFLDNLGLGQHNYSTKHQDLQNNNKKKSCNLT